MVVDGQARVKIGWVGLGCRIVSLTPGGGGAFGHLLSGGLLNCWEPSADTT